MQIDEYVCVHGSDIPLFTPLQTNCQCLVTSTKCSMKTGGTTSFTRQVNYVIVHDIHASIITVERCLDLAVI